MSNRAIFTAKMVVTKRPPPLQTDGRHSHEDIEYLSGQAFLGRLAAGALR